MNKKHPFIGPFVLLVSGILVSNLDGSGYWLFLIVALYGLFLNGKWLAHWGFLLVLLLPGLLGMILMDYHKTRYAETMKILQSAPSVLIKIQHIDLLNLTQNTEKIRVQAVILAQVDSGKIQFLPSANLDVVFPLNFFQSSSGYIEPKKGSANKITQAQEVNCRPITNQFQFSQWIGATVLIDGWKLSNSAYGKFPKHRIYLNLYSHWVVIPQLREPSFFQLLQHKIEMVIATKVKSCLSENAWNLFLKLMLGQKGAMDPTEMRFFQKAGIVHVLSVSGMHLALIFSVLFWPLKWIRWPWLHRISWLFIMFVIWLYGSMTGMSPPVERAVWAITYSQIGQQLFRRKIWIADSYFFIGSIQLIADPLMIFDVGFQLSYAAMAGIALVVPFFNEWMLQKEWPKWKENLLAGIVISIVCSITTLPVVLYCFHQFSNWFILGNLLLIPLFTVLIYAYLGLMILACIGFFELFKVLQSGCSQLFDVFLMLINKELNFIDELPYGYSYAPSFSGTHTILLSVFVAFWIHRIHFPHERKWTYWAFIPFLILVSL